MPSTIKKNEMIDDNRQSKNESTKSMDEIESKWCTKARMERQPGKNRNWKFTKLEVTRRTQWFQAVFAALNRKDSKR
jgi:hypothetical protein